MNFFSPCPRGLEPVLVEELRQLGAQKVEETAGGVGFQGDESLVYRVNLHSRIASRVLLEIARSAYRSEDDIYRFASAQKWEDWFEPDTTFRVDTTAVQTNLKSTAFVTLKVKDAVCDRMRAKFQCRPDVNTLNPKVRVSIFLHRETMVLYVDTSGEALFKRGWRMEKGDAPLRENLAAGLLALAGWRVGTPLFDPMCGSGTLLVEAAQQCLGISAGSLRHFGFQNLRFYDRDKWMACKAEVPAPDVTKTNLSLFGSDISGDMVTVSADNLLRAGVSASIPLKQVEAQFIEPPAASGIIVTNPPYGSRLSVRGDTTMDTDERYEAFFSALATTLKQGFSGWQVFILSADRDLPHLLRLKESRKTPIFNGAIECRFFRFDMVAGGNRKPTSVTKTQE